GLALPVPAAFLTGLDRSLSTERGEWNVLILGRRYPHGIWYYFALLWLLKTPVGLLVAEAVGLVRAARDHVLRASPAARLLAWNLGLTLVYFSLFFHAQIGFRFVLMAIPLALILAAAGLARIEPTPRLRAAGVALVLLAAAEDAPY